jgi:hypothetical protein
VIDYEKLKLAHELGSIATKGKRKRCDVFVSVYHNNEPIFGYIDFSHNRDVFEFYDIDELINALQKLIEPQPKYKIGQEVWVLDGNNIEVIAVFINNIVNNKYALTVFLGWFEEEDIFSSYDELIESQIKYWTDLKDNEYWKGLKNHE